MLATEADRFVELRLAERAFLSNLPLTDDYVSKLWEMRLGLFLYRHSNNVERGKPYPDFIVETNGQPVNVEATSASRGKEATRVSLGVQRNPIQVAVEDGKSELPKNAIYRPDFERVTARIETRMAEKIGKHKERLSSGRMPDPVSKNPTVIALDVTGVDDQLHDAYVAPIFWGLVDATFGTFDGSDRAIISKIEQVTIPDQEGLQKEVGFFRRHPEIAGVILGRSWRYQPLESWIEDNSLSFLINPWAERPVPECFLERMPRIEKVAHWISEGAVFEPAAHEVLPEPYKSRVRRLAE